MLYSQCVFIYAELISKCPAGFLKSGYLSRETLSLNNHFSPFSERFPMKLFGKLFKMSVCVAIGASATYAGADDGSNLWLKPLPSVVKTAEQTSTAAKTAEIIQAELKNFTKVRQVQIVLDTAEAKAHENDSFTISGNSQKITITAKNEIGALYGVYHLLRLQDTGFSFADTFTIKETPACKYRMLNH